MSLRRRKIPALKISRVDYDEGGLLAPRREYLRVTGEHHCFDLCAAPFGAGFFFSSWATKREACFVPLYLVSFAFLTWLIDGVLQGAVNGIFGISAGNGIGIVALLLPIVANPFVLLPIGLLMVLWFIGLTARGGRFGARQRSSRCHSSGGSTSSSLRARPANASTRCATPIVSFLPQTGQSPFVCRVSAGERRT